MPRFYGKVGYASPRELVAGIWSGGVTERAYFGEILNESSTTSSSDKVHDDLRLSSRISIVADAYAFEHYSKIKYVTDGAGTRWQVNTIELKRPRLLLSTGGVYSGQLPE